MNTNDAAVLMAMAVNIIRETEGRQVTPLQLLVIKDEFKTLLEDPQTSIEVLTKTFELLTKGVTLN